MLSPQGPYDRPTAPPLTRPAPAVDGPSLYLGLDLGQHHDPSALAALERHARGADPKAARYECRGLKRWDLGTPYTSIEAEVAGMFAGPPLAGGTLVVDETGVGRPVVEHIVRALRDPVTCPACKGVGPASAGLAPRPPAPHEDWFAASYPCPNCGGTGRAKPRCRVVPVTITPGSGFTVRPDGGFRVAKKDLVSVLIVLFGGCRLKIAGTLPWAGKLVQELGDFRVKVSTAANESFEAWREKDHDDLVLALALAAWFAEKGRKEFWLR